MPRLFLKISAVSLLLISLLLTAHAQKTSGSITGTVADATGAMVPEATVKAVEQNTNFTRTTTTNSEGSFTFPDVPAGVYNVTVTRQGFKEITQTGLQVHVADTKTMRFKLEVGAGSDVITVESSPVLVETQTGSISNIILGPQVRELPLNGRSFVQLTTLVPGASPAENIEFTNRGLFAGVDISYNGAAVTNNQWLVDGANNNDVGSQRTILIFPSIDAIEEFKIQRSSYGPEYGNAAGAQVNVITRGGGNHFHGSGYYFGRNDVLSAKSYFLGRGVTDCGPGDPRCEKGKLRWNGWGYTLGGPIKKNKIFFFWSQEWNREVRGQTRTGIVPTALELAGDFRQSCNFPSDPATGQRFQFGTPNENIIPANRLSPAGQAYLSTLPTANVTTDPCADPNWIDSVPIVQNWRQESVRGDIKLTNSTTLMLRWAQDSWVNGQHAAVERGLWGDDKYPAVDDAWNQPGKLAVAKLTTTFGSTAVNDFQFSWTGNRINIQRIGDEGLNDAVFATMPTFYPFSDKLRGDNQPIPICWCGGFSGVIGALGPWDNRQDLFAWRDDFSKVMGNHILKFGVAYDRNAKDEQVGQENGGFWGVAGYQSPWTATSGNQYADFLIRDTVWGWNESQAEFPIQIRWRTLEFYGGDSWKVHPRFTLEYGLRWSLLGRPFTDDNRLAGFSPDAYDPLLASPPASPCNGIVMAAGAPNECQSLGFAGGTFFENRALVHNDNNAIAPRLGFAWDVGGNARFVLRGGLGQFFARDRLTALDVGAVNPPFAISGGGERILDPDINDLDGDGNTTEFLTFDFGVGGSPQRGLDPEARLTNTWQWNLTADMELWKDTRFELAYVGTRGVHIQTTHNANQVIHGDLDNDGMDDRLQNALGQGTNRPFAAGDSEGRIIIWSNRGDSIYHALQTMFSTKFGRGSIAQFAYTWSRSIGNASLAYVGTDQAIPDIEDPRANRGPVDFDRTHIFSANLIYHLPELNDRNAFVRNAIGGWQLGSIISLSSGPALTVIGDVQGSPSPSGTSAGQQFANRPLRVFSEPCRSNSSDPVQWLNPNAFTWNGFDLGTNGNTGPGQCSGPPTRTLDLAFDKNWKLPWFGGDTARLQFRFEIFNAFNTPQFRDVNLEYNVQGSAACGGTDVLVANDQFQGATLCNGSFGKARNVGRLNREMQYGLKLIF
ncbi:MAG: carboxypeptidase regulatory-like domain-containing protein [Terriglobales bacterium]